MDLFKKISIRLVISLLLYSIIAITFNIGLNTGNTLKKSVSVNHKWSKSVDNKNIVDLNTEIEEENELEEESDDIIDSHQLFYFNKQQLVFNYKLSSRSPKLNFCEKHQTIQDIIVHTTFLRL